jgi:ribosomal protein S18 acetylase RimI-like enzyme
MAARPDDTKAEIADLRLARGSELEALLEEERQAWRDAIHWDFGPSADLIRRYVDIRALNGSLLRVNRRAAGYSYHVSEEKKTLIGNLFVVPPLATPETEHRLLHATLADAFHHYQGTRVEAQLMMLRHQPEHGRLAQSFPGLRGRTFRRYFMLASIADRTRLSVPEGILLAPWDERYAEGASHLIADAYRSHIDSEINDQYRTAAGSRRFLANIVLYPGCGAFQGRASFAALHRGSGDICGMSLASIVAPGTGHITQICVAPSAQHSGVGSALLTRSLDGLRRAGCHEVSLTVTADNASAVRLYERLGFQVLRDFAAHVWEKPSEPL